MKYCLLYILFLFSAFLQAQNSTISLPTKEFSYEEFIGYIKKFHPLVKQANLKISEGQAKLIKARGAFDPKLEADLDKKQFGDQNYYTLFNGGLKVPTWYGIELKTAFNKYQGAYLNPQNTLPVDGLISLGLSVPIIQGLWINERMAELKQAKLYLNITAAEQQLLLSEVLYQASTSYINWKRAYDEFILYQAYFKNVQTRYDGIVASIIAGDKAAIDSTEVGLIVKTRQLNLENAKLKLTKATLELSNYLWIENNVPLELDSSLYPQNNIIYTIPFILRLNDLETVSIKMHPKLISLENKIDILKINKKLYANKLLPKIDLSYNYLAQPNTFNNYGFEDYKIGLNFSYPLFLRKERANLKQAKIELDFYNFEFLSIHQNLSNKIEAQKQEIFSFERQIKINKNLVNDYNKMLNAEERLFQTGASSIFLINTRETSLINAQLSTIALENAYLYTYLNLYKTLSWTD